MITVEPFPEVEPARADPRRWITLAIILMAVLIAALDSTVLNVAIPTILRDFNTTLPALQWVITGYTLTFAALLIIGGRLGDIFGARRMFIVGAALFGIGSLIASLSTGVPTLVLGEAVIEGIGASLMLPATMGILSSTFVGRERSTAFGAWGAAMGAAVAFGPVLGGFLTTHYSWRWAFRINVIVVPIAIAGALIFMRRVAPSGRREHIDVPGAVLIAGGMLALVFGISEGGTSGWFRPLTTMRIGGIDVWPQSRLVSIVPVAFAVSIVMLLGFYQLERAKERNGTDPLFEFSQLRFRAFRYGLSTLLLLAMGQIAFLFILSVFLQDGLGLSAVDTGLWLVPSGLFIVVGSQLGARLTRRIGTTRVVQLGLCLEALGLGAVALAISPAITFWRLVPGFALFGIGIGFAGSQLTNVILADIAPHKAGAASGANTTVRMLGASLGIAVITTLIKVDTSGRTDIASVAAGVRPPLIFATCVVSLGFAVSFLIPRITATAEANAADSERAEMEIDSELMAETFAVQ